MMDPAVTELLDQHKEYFEVQGNGRLVCILNQHSLPASRQALDTFVNGKKYGQLRKKAEEAKSLSRFEPFLVASKNFPGQLYCSLTCQVMQAKLDTVKKHMSGKRFNAAKAGFEKDERELMEEPDIETSAENEDASPMEEDEQAAAASSISLPDIVDVVAMSDDTRLVAPATADKPDVKVGQKRKQQDSSTNQLPRNRGKPGKRKAAGSAGG